MVEDIGSSVVVVVLIVVVVVVGDSVARGIGNRNGPVLGLLFGSGGPYIEFSLCKKKSHCADGFTFTTFTHLPKESCL
uniref:Uncharacterized protein n=1 Tax=Panstrongylus lignarius TaxID=156445 RepID=A0A224XT46_9HEMI